MSKEKLLEQLESVANFMRGMQFDPRLPNDIKQALIEKAIETDDLVQACLESD